MPPRKKLRREAPDPPHEYRGDCSRTPAPILHVAPRQIVAVEHPMIVMNLDNGMKTFGRNKPFERILASNNPEECVPLYLRYNDPMCIPILSHNAPTNNVLLKITVPKRTGRRRKRGSQDPFLYENEESPAQAPTIVEPLAEGSNLLSYARKDKVETIQRALQDNLDRCTIEAVGEIRQSHRYRGISDFHHSVSKTEFMPKFQETLIHGGMEEVRKYRFSDSRGWKKDEEFMPPPVFTNHSLPFNWGWHQNPNIGETVDAYGRKTLINRSKPRRVELPYLNHDIPDQKVPAFAALEEPKDPDLIQLIGELKVALEERPIWTRRALVNKVGNSEVLYMIKRALQYVGYQFKGGPWRDAIIKYGIDPRTDKKYRPYQTFFFKIYDEEERTANSQWHDIRTNFNHTKRSGKKKNLLTHLFDGKSVTLDGKVWQACDITDPLIANLIKNAPYPDHCENNSDGWFCNGTAAKIKSIMRTKIQGIQVGRLPPDEDFKISIEAPDYVPDKTSREIQVPIPDVKLTPADLERMKSRGVVHPSRSSGIKRKDFNVRKRTERIRPLVNGDKPRIPQGMRNQGGRLHKVSQSRLVELRPLAPRPAASAAGSSSVEGEYEGRGGSEVTEDMIDPDLEQAGFQAGLPHEEQELDDGDQETDEDEVGFSDVYSDDDSEDDVLAEVEDEDDEEEDHDVHEGEGLGGGEGAGEEDAEGEDDPAFLGYGP